MKHEIKEKMTLEIELIKYDKTIYMQRMEYTRGSKKVNYDILLDYYPVKNSFVYELVNRDDSLIYEGCVRECAISLDNVENLNIGNIGNEKIVNIGCLTIRFNDYKKLDIDDLINISLHSHIDSKEKCIKRAEKVYKIMLEYIKCFKE